METFFWTLFWSGFISAILTSIFLFPWLSYISNQVKIDNLELYEGVSIHFKLLSKKDSYTTKFFLYTILFLVPFVIGLCSLVGIVMVVIIFFFI